MFHWTERGFFCIEYVCQECMCVCVFLSDCVLTGVSDMHKRWELSEYKGIHQTTLREWRGIF